MISAMLDNIISLAERRSVSNMRDRENASKKRSREYLNSFQRWCFMLIVSRTLGLHTHVGIGEVGRCVGTSIASPAVDYL